MTSMMRNIKIFGMMTVVLSVLVCFATDAVAQKSATYDSQYLKISGKLPECSYPQKRGGGNCLKNLNAKSCMDTTPFQMSGKAAYGVSSEMCARGHEWCEHNKSGGRYVSSARCPIPPKQAKNHQGYDYSAACGTPIYAPCDGRITVAKKNGMHFVCQMCGKTFEYTFYHNQAFKPAGSYSRGQKIGEAGNLNGYPCHMHIEIREGGVLLDPMNKGFDAYACSCQPEKQINRMNCFGGTGGAEASSNDTYNGGDEGPRTGEIATTAEDTKIPQSGPCKFEEILANYLQAGCIFCTPFRILFNTASIMAKSVYDIFAPAMVKVVVIGFALWLAFIILRFVSHFETREPRILVKTLLNQAFKVLIIVLLLQGPLEDMLSMTLDPVFSTGLKIAQIGGGLAGGGNPAECNIEPMQKANVGAGVIDKVVGGAVDLALNTVAPAGPIPSVVGSDVGGLSPELGNGIQCTIKVVQDRIIEILAMGRMCHCLAWENTILVFIPNMAYLVTAFAFFIFAFVMLLSYPFLLIDSLLKMAISIALLPVALGAFAFKATSQYLSKVFGTFVHAVLTFIFLSLVIMILATIAGQYKDEILSEDVKLGIRAITWFMVPALKMMFVLFLGWATLSEIQKFAKDFAGNIWGGSGVASSMTPIGSPVGAAANAAFKNRVAKPIGKTAVKGLKFAGGIGNEGLKHGYRGLKGAAFNSYGIAATNADGTAMLDDEGNQMYESSRPKIGTAWNAAVDKLENKAGKSGIGKLVSKGLNKVKVKTHNNYRSYNRDETGNIVETKTRVNSDGSRTVTRSDDFGSSTMIYNADGQVVGTSFTYSKAMQHMIDAKGRVNNAAINAFVQSSLLSEKEKQLMVVDMLVKARMNQYTGGKIDGRFQTRNVRNGVDAQGNNFIEVEQINEDGTMTSFNVTFKGDRAMTTVITVDKNRKGVAYASDGIVQRKTAINGDTVRHQYSIAKEYSDQTARPVFMDGSLASNIKREDIMFSSEDMKRFAEQVRDKGNKAYTLPEFK